jgi:chromosome segregation ATPase
MTELEKRSQETQESFDAAARVLDTLTAQFEVNRLKLTPAQYSEAKSRLEQQAMIVGTAKAERDAARDLVAHAQNANARNAARAQAQRDLESTSAAAKELSDSIEAMNAQLGSLPELIARTTAKHTVMLRRIAELRALLNPPPPSQPATWYTETTTGKVASQLTEALR